MDKDNYMKFPSILRTKIQAGEFTFPKNTKFEYEPIQGYRGIERKEGDNTPVTRKDFRSYAELKRRRRALNTEDPHYYGVSLYLDKGSVENALKFPRIDKKIACGKVYQQAGPIEVNEKTGHICWWLYDNVEIEGFVIC